MSDKKNLKVLIIDDAFFIRNLIKRAVLTKPEDSVLGYKFEVIGEAINGTEGIVQYFKMKPDLITLDINMPDINGIEVTKQILSKDPDAKIIVISGNLDEKVKQDILNAGALEYIQKPFQNTYLWEKLDKVTNMLIGENHKEKIESAIISEESVEILKEHNEENVMQNIKIQESVQEVRLDKSTEIDSLEDCVSDGLLPNPIIQENINEEDDDDDLLSNKSYKQNSVKKTTIQKPTEDEGNTNSNQVKTEKKSRNRVSESNISTPIIVEENSDDDIVKAKIEGTSQLIKITKEEDKTHLNFEVEFDIDKELPSTETLLVKNDDFEILLPEEDEISGSISIVEDVDNRNDIKTVTTPIEKKVIIEPKSRQHDEVTIIIDTPNKCTEDTNSSRNNIKQDITTNDSIHTTYEEIDKGFSTDTTLNNELNNNNNKYNTVSIKVDNSDNENESKKGSNIAPPRNKALRDMYSDVVETQYNTTFPDDNIESESEKITKKEGLFSSLKKKLFNKK